MVPSHALTGKSGEILLGFASQISKIKVSWCFHFKNTKFWQVFAQPFQVYELQNNRKSTQIAPYPWVWIHRKPMLCDLVLSLLCFFFVFFLAGLSSLECRSKLKGLISRRFLLQDASSGFWGTNHTVLVPCTPGRNPPDFLPHKFPSLLVDPSDLVSWGGNASEGLPSGQCWVGSASRRHDPEESCMVHTHTHTTPYIFSFPWQHVPLGKVTSIRVELRLT